MKLSEKTIKSLIETSYYSSDGNNIYGKCPACEHKEFGISLIKENHPFGCFRKKKCGFEGNIYDLLKFLDRWDLIEEEETIDFKIDPIDENVKKGEDIEVPEVKLPIGFKRIYNDKYLKKRGFIDDNFYKYEIGVSNIEMRNYIIFVIWQNGKRVGYVGRYKGNAKIRYNNSQSDFSKIIGGYDELPKKTAILTEGIIDKVATENKLKLDKDAGVFCTFGAKISDYHVRFLKDNGVENIILMFESDVADKIKKYSSKLYVNFKNTEIVKFPIGYDPNDLTNEELNYYFNNNSENFITFVSNTLT